MIEINLLPGQKRRAPAGAGFKLPDFGTLFARVRDPWLLGAVGSWVVVAGGAAALFVFDKAQYASAESLKSATQQQESRFEVLIRQKQDAVRTRDSLVLQLSIIRKIDSQRYVWAHVLDQVSKALPAYTWLSSISQVNAQTQGPRPGGPGAATQPADTAAPPVNVSVLGRTVDIQAFTTFMRQLAASPWIADVQAVNSQIVMDQNRPVTSFSITFQYRTADSAFIRTVPLAQSVR